jgi:hypothetical protein
MEEESAEDLELATGSANEAGGLASTWWWLVRRNAWLLVWGAALLVYLTVRSAVLPGVAATGQAPPAFGVTFMGWALFLLPLLLRSAEELSSRTLAELIEGDDAENRPPLGRRLLRESAIGAATGLVAGVIALALVYVLHGESNILEVPFAATTAASAFLTVLVGSLLGHLALVRSGQGKRVSGTGLALTAMVIGAAIYLAAAYAAGVAWVTSELANRM